MINFYAGTQKWLCLILRYCSNNWLYAARRSIAFFTKPQCNQFWTTSIKSTLSHHISLRTIFNIILPFKPRYPKLSRQLRYSVENSVCTYVFLLSATWMLNVASRHIYNFLQPLMISSLLWQQPVVKHPQSMFSLQSERPNFTCKEKAGNKQNLRWRIEMALHCASGTNTQTKSIEYPTVALISINLNCEHL
jgi:tRNA U38,U39,U40 pseudouridine synthase TruA